jgi:hypothetical protein
MNQNPQVKLTRVMADPNEGLLPHAYVVYKQSQLCRCGHLHQWTQMMAETHIRSTLGHKYITNHRVCRVEDIKYNLPVKCIEAQTEKVLFCHECHATASLAHLPPPPKPQDSTVAQTLRASPLMQNQPPRTRHWKDGTERYEDVSKATPKAKPKTTLDDLLI